MNTLVIVLIAAVCLIAAYALYGRWLAKKWGIDPKAKTPAVIHNDGQDYVPTDGWTVFAHQFSSIAGAGPVTGAIQAAAFGWLPVLLWIILGGIFFGAVTDFGALYASVKNDGKSMGLLIEKYIGKAGRKLFLGFCWLFCLIVIAAFADMVADTFNAYVVTDGVQTLSENATVNGAAGSISLFFILFAVVFGVVQHKVKFTGWKEVVFGLVCTVLAFVFGMNFPVILGKDMWVYIAFVYIFLAAVLPMWFVMQPRDYMSTFMFIGMIAGAVLGLIFAHPTMNLPAYTGFNNESLGTLFPILFVTVACGAVSGFHSLVSSGTSSKTISNEKDMLKVGYGAMVLESLLAVIALCVAGAAAGADGTAAVGTPFQIFSSGVAGFLEMFGIPVYVAQSFMTMCVSALAFTTLDSVARIGRMSFQELFSVDDMEHAAGWRKVLCNKYFSTIITLVFGYILTQVGYSNIWPLFGSANQLLSALVLITLCVFLKVTGRTLKTLVPPFVIMLIVTFTALVQRFISLVKAFSAGTGVFMVEGLQLIVAVLLMILGVTIVVTSGKELIRKKAEN
ncbi:carbon starvation protein A [Mediterraneibacter glycyrrhizinilyticus]|uniref:carbon starvation CstA family protein n=1 Tax=Mediterraneibacter glycyrrhizinilyticus TaxID=342942 RepID=UPI00196157B5|nr:carbon starvation CstA family protein [Mediterraneibacter glycyrrhizinilyticus]MBM6803794.1 carbon starvation protein A [Mediterraneibacter glycyrrhizinilyticus]MDM8124061.1 carbon starvation CstA family protein [Mediterraneibacter glycyrrhizinilyticus]